MNCLGLSRAEGAGRLTCADHRSPGQGFHRPRADTWNGPKLAVAEQTEA